MMYVESQNSDLQNELNLNTDPLLVEGVKKYDVEINFKAKFEDLLSRDEQCQESCGAHAPERKPESVTGGEDGNGGGGGEDGNGGGGGEDGNGVFFESRVYDLVALDFHGPKNRPRRWR